MYSGRVQNWKAARGPRSTWVPPPPGPTVHVGPHVGKSPTWAPPKIGFCSFRFVPFGDQLAASTCAVAAASAAGGASQRVKASSVRVSAR